LTLHPGKNHTQKDAIPGYAGIHTDFMRVLPSFFPLRSLSVCFSRPMLALDKEIRLVFLFLAISFNVSFFPPPFPPFFPFVFVFFFPFVSSLN